MLLANLGVQGYNLEYRPLLMKTDINGDTSVSYTHLRAHETVLDLVCRLLLEKKILYIRYTTITYKCLLIST